MSENVVPSSDELIKRADQLVPLIRSRALSATQNRNLDDEVVEALAEAGMFELRRPLRYGGYETSARGLFDVVSTLSAGDGSTGWNTAVWAIGSWMAAAFPDHVQDEVFATPATRICVVLSPTAVATETDGGLRVNGRWRFMSGARHSHWQIIITMAPAPDGSQWPVAALVPMSELKVEDDWYASGLAATGSVTTVAEDLFVPLERTLPMPAILQGQYATELNADSPVFRTPMIPTGASGFIGVAVGMGRAALDEFLGRLPGRKITFTDYAEQSAAPVTHFQVAEAALKLDEAEFHAHRMVDLLDEKGTAGEPWTLRERMRNRGWLGRLVELVGESVNTLADASGGSSIYTSVPIQRIQRDMQAFTLHGLMHPNTNFELYGRELCGLEPNTMYI
ncbi:acyl-CoA dehydrogenase [Nocardiopsis sp. YSL2]|uniref:acyl-CoA dehydrogenase n=1 Tax=Nocardiopsis sp. YSL2 TaxID=2939492 RepID=UPI0026F46A3F|nr:acyl-CoA dehydrogenase [Nocardiopsis sp. YSL2]